MNLIQDHSKVKVPNLFEGRRKWFWLGGLLIFLVVSQLLENKMGVGQSPRVLEYSEKMKLPADHNDSLQINLLYEKLNAVYDRINTLDLDTMQDFGGKLIVPPDFQPKLITYELLDYVLDTTNMNSRAGKSFRSQMGYYSFFDDVNASAGNGNFADDFSTRKYNKGFAGDAGYVINDQYMMVLVSREFTSPDYTEGAKEFMSGTYTGSVLVFDISTLEIVGHSWFTTSNSSEVRNLPYKRDKQIEVLILDLEKNIKGHVNKISEQFLGRVVWPYG